MPTFGLFNYILTHKTHVFFKRAPFGFQKDSFCIVKGPLLHSKRTPFGV